MFVNKLFPYLTTHISKSKRCFNVKSSTYCFHMKSKILVDFQICISVPLIKHLSYCKQPICSANQWTGFYMTTASVMKGLNIFTNSFQIIALLIVWNVAFYVELEMKINLLKHPPYICLSLKNQPLNYVHSLPGDTGNEMDLLIGSHYYWSFVTGNAKRVEGSS